MPVPIRVPIHVFNCELRHRARIHDLLDTSSPGLLLLLDALRATKPAPVSTTYPAKTSERVPSR